MCEDIEKWLKNTGKAELLEILEEELEDADKVVVALVKHRDEGRYHSIVMTLGIDYSYEAFGILRVAEEDIKEEE